MMTPDDLYWHASQMGSAPSLERVEQLRQAATTWKAQGQLFAAGMAYSAVTNAGWGLLDRTTRLECASKAVAAFQSVAQQSSAGSLDDLVAFKKWSEELWHVDYDGIGGRQQHMRDSEALSIAHAERLVSRFSDHPHAVSFLVRGYLVRGPITGPWEPEYPDGEVNDSGYSWDLSRRFFIFPMPSAFQLFVRAGDYNAAREICGRYPTVFTSPGLRGWRLVVEGFAGWRGRSANRSGVTNVFPQPQDACRTARTPIPASKDITYLFGPWQVFSI